MKYLPAGFFLALLIIGLSAKAPTVQAQSFVNGKSIADLVLQKTNELSDSIVGQDQDLYTRLNIGERFGIQFRPHVRVCADAPDGEAHCNARVVTDTRGVPAAQPDLLSPRVTPKALPAGYGPKQFLSAYNLTGQASGHPIVAIVDAYDDPNIANDLTTYSTMFGIPKLPTCVGAIANSAVACFQKVNQNGQTRSYPRTNAGWALEIALDVETAHAVCQNCSILLVEANSASYTNLMKAIDQAVTQGAKIVSNSWGSGEFSSETTYDSHFNRPGVAFTVSSGDSGYAAEYPASSPYVTAVGGTSLFLNPDSTYNSEVAWSGSGSGCSVYEAKPVWQSDAGCAKRTVADVSAVADPNTGAAVYDTVRYGSSSGWFQVGGTSLAAPLIAAVYALSGNTGGAANAIPYAHAAALRDITTGTNGSCGGSYLCTALAGFDGPTGLGTPNGVGAF